MRSNRRIVAFAIIAVAAPAYGFAQQTNPLPRDSILVSVSQPDVEEETLLGEDPAAIEAASWERQSVPVSLTAIGVRGIPSVPDRPTGRPRSRESTRLVYIEASVSRTNGIATAPADTLLLGTPYASILRIRLHPARCWDGHLVLAKQAGERVADAALRGSVSYSGDEGVRLILGDFVANASHGLTLSGNRASIGEGVNRSPTSRETLLPYFGSGTMGYFRGIAVRFRKAMWSSTGNLALLVSRRPLAATIREDGSVRSIDWTGYERTEKESQKQSRLHETFIAARCLFESNGGLAAGVTWSRTLYDRRIEPASGLGFSGDRSEVTGLDLAITMGRARLSGEIARLLDGSLAFVSSVNVRPAVGTTVVLHVRSYGAGFSNPHASAFGHHRDGGNERGVFMAISTRPDPCVAVDGSFDLYRYPGRSSSSMFPSSGAETGLQATIGRSDETTVTLRLRAKHTTDERLVTVIPSKEMRRDVSLETLSVGGIVRIPLTPEFQVKGRFSTVLCRPDCGLPTSRGSLLGVGAAWRRRDGVIECAMSIFTAQSYDAAVSIAEPGAARTVSAIMCYGSGTRISVFGSWSPWDALLVSLKLGSTMYGWKPSSDGIPNMCPSPLTNFVVEFSVLL